MTPKKILVVEDSPDLADSLIDILNIKGYHTLKAGGGYEALDIATKETPDLILLDLKLPDIDGYEVYRRLKSNTRTENTRVLILTASDTYDGAPVDLEINSEDILHKPHWGINELATRVETELGLL